MLMLENLAGSLNRVFSRFLFKPHSVWQVEIQDVAQLCEIYSSALTIDHDKQPTCINLLIPECQAHKIQVTLGTYVHLRR